MPAGDAATPKTSCREPGRIDAAVSWQTVAWPRQLFWTARNGIRGIAERINPKIRNPRYDEKCKPAARVRAVVDEQPIPDKDDILPIDFGNQPDSPHSASARNRPGRPAGNAALMRLVFLTGMLVMVVWAMRVSGRAETWNWLFPQPARDAREKPDSSPQPRDDVATGIRLADAVVRGGKGSETDANQATSPANGPAEPSAASPPWTMPRVDSARQFEREFLRGFLRSLSGRDQAGFYSLLDNIARQNPLPAGETAVAASLIRQFTDRWNAWQVTWESSIATAPDNPAVRQEISSLIQSWNSSVVPTFDSALLGTDESPVSAEFTAFRQAVRGAADSLVVQSTPVGRPAESYAWVAAWSDVFDQPLAIDSENLPRPTITQLLGQPEAWSGQTVAIAGTALLIQRAPAGKNLPGIRDYHVIWIRPDHVSSFPYCLYTLLPPESLALNEGENRKRVEIPVSASARFFKVRMFDGDGQAGQAPLLMSSTLEIRPDPEPVASRPEFVFPAPATTAAVIVVIAALASWLAWLAYRTSLGGKLRSAPSTDRMHSAMQQLRGNPEVETIRQKLERLGRKNDSPE